MRNCPLQDLKRSVTQPLPEILGSSTPMRLIIDIFFTPAYIVGQAATYAESRRPQKHYPYPTRQFRHRDSNACGVRIRNGNDRLQMATLRE